MAYYHFQDTTSSPPLGQEQRLSSFTSTWDLPAKFRPDYPPATIKQITDFHRAHSNSLRLAHCIGIDSVSVRFVQKIAEYFQHIHISDPDPVNLAHAKAKLSEWYQENWWKAKFSFSVVRAEGADLPFVKGSVDFCCLLDSASRSDVKTTVQAVAGSLAPNGTLAVVQVSPACRVFDNDPVDKAVQKLFRAVGEDMMSRASDGPASEEIKQSNSGLDYVPLPEPEFIQDVTKRIKINITDRGSMPFALVEQKHLVAPSKIGPLQREYEFADPEPEAEGWTRKVDAGWFRGYVGSLGVQQEPKTFEEQLQEVEKAFKESETVVVDWAAAIVLATRK